MQTCTARHDWLAAESLPRPPHVEVRLDSHAAAEALHRDVLGVCAGLLPGWGGLQPEEVGMQKIAGGITNILVQVWCEKSRLLPPRPATSQRRCAAAAAAAAASSPSRLHRPRR